MKKTILSVTAIAAVCISGCISAYAATQLLLRYEKSHNKGIVQNVENKNKFF